MIHVLGTGSIGSLLATYFANGNAVKLIMRPASRQKFTKLGSRINLHMNSKVITTKFESTDPQSISHISKLVVATKTFQLQNAIESVAKYLNKDSEVLIFHNGMGIQKCLKSIQHCNLGYGITNAGVKRIGDYQFKYTGGGSAFVSGDTPQLFSRLYKSKLLNVNQVNETEFSVQQRYKLAVNAVINPLTALLEVSNGELLKLQSNKLIADLVKECSDLLDLDPGIVWEQLWNVVQLTSSNRSSMLTDVKCGHNHGHETEIDYVNGYLADLPLPNTNSQLNTTLTQLIKMKTQI